MNRILNCEIEASSRHNLDAELVITTSSYQTTGEIPLPRSGHVACLIERQDSIFMHGGSDKKNDYSDCYILNIKQRKWSKVGIELKDPEKFRLTGHKCTMFSSFEHCASNIMLFGGWDGERYSNQITLVNLQSKQVRQSQYSESERRIQVTATKNTKSTLDGKLAMKADSSMIAQQLGQVKDENLSNTNDRNKIVAAQTYPPGVRDHSLVYDYNKNAVLLFGGWDSLRFEFGSNEFNYLWILDSKWNWFNVKTSGQIPSGRRGHTCIVVQQPYGLLIFGGVHGYNKIVNECFFLDLNTFNWRQIDGRENNFFPSPRAFHSGTLVRDKIIYYGGLMKRNKISNQIIVYDLITDQWTDLDNSTSAIPPLMMHSAICTEDDQLLIFGGTTDDYENQNLQKPISLETIFVLKCDFIDHSLVQQNPIPKRQQKEEQLHWNMMAFPVLETIQTETSQIQLQSNSSNGLLSDDSEAVELVEDLMGECKFYQKMSKAKITYHLSQVIEEGQKLMLDSFNGQEGINEVDHNSEEEDNNGKYYNKGQDPFQNFPEEEDGD